MSEETDCEVCGGLGYLDEPMQDCCGSVDETGSCCGMLVTIPPQCGCFECDGTGKVKIND